MKEISFEIKRKIFHLGSIIFPIIYIYSSKTFIIILLFLLTSVEVVIDIYRHRSEKINNLALKVFSSVMRKDEAERSVLFSGASYMFIGLLSSAILFPKGLVINSWLILTISDSIAALIGKKYGTNEIILGKTMEGTFTFFFSALFISIITFFSIHYNTSFFIIIMSCLITTMAELWSKPIIGIDDNLSIPLSFCITTTLLKFLL